MRFHIYTAETVGGKHSKRLHESNAFFRRFVNDYVEMLKEVKIGNHHASENRGPIHIKWTYFASETSAVAIFFSVGMPSVVSLFLSEGNEHEQDAIEGFENLVHHISPDGLSSDFHIPQIESRPAVVSVPLPFASPRDLRLIDDMEKELAAAFFEPPFPTDAMLNDEISQRRCQNRGGMIEERASATEFLDRLRIATWYLRMTIGGHTILANHPRLREMYLQTIDTLNTIQHEAEKLEPSLQSEAEAS